MVTRVTVQTILSEHISRYTEELQQRQGDLSRAYYGGYEQATIDVLRHQVDVLEGQWEALTALEEELQEKVPSMLDMP